MLRNVTFRPSAGSAFGAAAAAWLCLATAATAQAVSPQAAVVCKPIRTAAQLQAMRNDPTGTYCLEKDIDASSIANFVPIGELGALFRGKLFGNGKVIRNLKVNSDSEYAGLFGIIQSAVIQDVGLVNADIVGTNEIGASNVGGLVGYAFQGGGGNEIRRVHVSGRVAATGPISHVGGIVGLATDASLLADSLSSAAVNGGGFAAGGAIGRAGGSTIRRVHATGPAACTAKFCKAGGLIGYAFGATVDRSYASGAATAGEDGDAGGLAGRAAFSTITRSHALGAVATGTGNATAGGLIGHLEGGTTAEVYAAGRVSGGAGATLGGLVGLSVGTPVTNGYWDTVTSAQAASAAGVGYTTAQLRNVLPIGFANAWAITKNKSYPFLNEADIDFAAPLATLVKTGRVYTFLPIGQREKSEYATPPANANAASLAAVYTIIARAIGVTKNIARLRDATINVFWKDAAKTAVWRGPVTTRATLGTFKAIAAKGRLSNANVIGEMKIGNLVILRGTYTKANGAKAEHWLLGTLYTASGNVLDSVIANDPWTGMQVTIDPATKKVVWPADFPLANFKVDGYQPVTVN
jgi:hypothetical protein